MPSGSWPSTRPGLGGDQMLGVVSAEGSCLDAGSVGLSMARLWAGVGRHVLFIDATTVGEPLAERAGAAMRSEYRPEIRGLPSLITARKPLNLSLTAEHCFSLGTGTGSLWALFGPNHPEGRQIATRWLEERVSDLAEINRQRTIVLASSLKSPDDAQAPLLKALPALAFLAPANSREELNSLRSLCDACGLLAMSPDSSSQQRALVIVGDSAAVGDNEAMGITKLYLEGRLPQITDERLLRMQRGRKGREFFRRFDRVSERLWRLSNLNDGTVSRNVAEVSAATRNNAPEGDRGVGAVLTLTNGSPEGTSDRFVAPRRGEMEV